MNHLIARTLQNIEDVTDGAPEPKTLSAGATPDKGAAPLVGTGEMVVRPELHILLCDGKVRGWTDNREWAEQWANQYYLRSFVSNVLYVRPHNTSV